MVIGFTEGRSIREIHIADQGTFRSQNLTDQTVRCNGRGEACEIGHGNPDPENWLRTDLCTTNKRRHEEEDAGKSVASYSGEKRASMDNKPLVLEFKSIPMYYTFNYTDLLWHK